MWGSGTLPADLSLAFSGNISGTPMAEGTFNFIVQVMDDLSQTGTKSLSITISAAP
jgi:hypothetical protein